MILRPCVAAAALALLAGCHAPAHVAPRPRVLFFDDFAGDSLDRSKWTVRITGRTVNEEQQAYVDSADVLTVSEGSLVIRPRFRPGFKSAEGRSYDFISGRIDTKSKVSFTYGKAAARMKLAAGAGLWPAFWALGDGRWPDTGEIDIMENVGDAAWTSVALHGPGYSGNTPLVMRTPLPVRRLRSRPAARTPRAGTCMPSSGRGIRCSSRGTTARSTGSRARWSSATAGGRSTTPSI